MFHKKNILIALLSVAVVLTGLLILNDRLTDSSSSATNDHFIKERFGAMGIGTPEDRYARLEFEKRRLADPATGEIPAGIRAKELAFAAGLPKKIYGPRTTTWQARGPYNVGGRTRALKLDVTDENTILAGGVTGGVWRSTDGGASYVKTTAPDQLHSVTTIAQDRRAGNTDTWYYGTGEYYAIISSASFSNQASGNGIYKSTDGGQSWQVLPSTVSNTPNTLYQQADFDFVWRIVTDHTELNDDVVYAAVVNGIYKSTDGGTSWTPVLGLDTTINNRSDYTDIMITPNGVLYATISRGTPSAGIYRSTDGDTWTEISPASWPNNARRTVMAYAPTDENQLYFLGYTPNSGLHDHTLYKYTYLSGDGSGTNGQWENRSQNLPTFPCEVFYDFEFGNYNSQSAYDMDIKVKPDNADVVFLGGTNVYRSTDGFTSDSNTTWQGGYRCDSITPSDYIYRDHHPDQHWFTFLPSDPNVLFTASDGGVHRTNNCMADTIDWIPLNNGYVTSQFYTVAVEPGHSSSNVLVGGMQDNGTFYTSSGQDTEPWQFVFYGDGAFCEVTPDRENYYLSWQTGKTFKFDIAGDGTVLGKTRIDPDGGSGYQFINPFILDPVTYNTMYLSAGRYIWRNDSLDAIPIIGDEYNTISQGWTRLDVSQLIGGVFSSDVSALGMSPDDNSVLYYGSSGGDVYRLDSVNGPENAITRTSLHPNISEDGYVSSVVVNRQDADEVLLTFSNYGVQSIWHTTDGGATWQHVSGNLEENPDGSGSGPSVMWTGILNLPDTTIYYAGTSVGLYSTTLLDSANTVWQQEGSTTIGNVVINMIVTRPYDGMVAVATHGNGMYSTRYKDVTGIAEAPVSGTTLKLSPNPMSSTQQVSFSLDAPSITSLAVYSLEGRMVHSIHQGQLAQGQHRFNWQGKDSNGQPLPAGTYIVELTAGSERTTAKAMVVR